MKKLHLVSLVALFVLFSCDKYEDKPAQQILKGPDVAIGTGKANSFIQLDYTGKPVSVGLTFTEDVLNSLPEDVAGEEIFFVLPLPSQNETVVDHISFDYAPHGHVPPGIYDVPHFDVHFYEINEAERNVIDPADPKMEILPSAEFIPTNYVPTPGGEPQMGKHWVDSLSPELHGQPFTQTLVYGSYDGKFHFYEPMIALSYLQSKPNKTFVVKQSAKVSKTGYQPTEYSIKYDEATRLYTISLDKLQFITAQ